MRNIEITFRRNVSTKQQKATLEKIKSWDSIEASGHLMENSTDENIRRMAFANVADDTEVEAVSKRLESIPEVETAQVSPKRYF